MNPIDLLIVGLGCGVFAWALSRYAPTALPGAGLAAQGVLGVYTGLMVRDISFAALGSHWPIVVAIAISTLIVSVAGGALLGLRRDVSPLTGGLALVAGGSSGLVAIARELGGDDRVVAAVQYLRGGPARRPASWSRLPPERRPPMPCQSPPDRRISATTCNG